MYCNNCQKEIEGEFLFCPHCGNSIQQEIVPFEGEDEYSEKKYERKIKEATQKLKWAKVQLFIRRIFMLGLSCIFILLCCSFCIRYAISKNKNYLNQCLIYDSQFYEYEIKKSELENEIKNKRNEQIKLAEQEKKLELANYEMELEDIILQSREEQVKSCLVSPENSTKVDEYIKALYRYTESKIELDTFNDESYYLIKDYIMLDKYNLTDSTNNTIYPGAILKGDSLFKGDYTVVPVEQMPIVLMSNQLNGEVETIIEPNYSNVSIALNQYINNYAGDISKEWSYQLLETSTSQEMNLSLGVGMKNNSLGVNASSTNKKSQMAIVYSQIYYTVSAEPKSNAFDYFKDGVDLKILGGYEPAYVSSVDYGRKIILIISSDLSQKELAAKLNANIKGVDLAMGMTNVLKDESLECEILAYGGEDISSILGNPNSNIGLVGEIKSWVWGDEDRKNEKTILDRVNNIIANGNKLINPVPISYDLKYLSDNAPVPTMCINSEKIMIAEDTQFIALSSKEEIIVDITALPATLLNVNEVQFENGKAKGTKFELVCSDLDSLPIKYTYKGKSYDDDLADYKMEETGFYKDGLKGLFGNNIEIYKTKYPKHYIQ